MKLTIRGCQGCRQCAQMYPQYFEISDDGTAYIKKQPPVEEQPIYTGFCTHIETYDK